MVDNRYALAYSEVLEILKYIPIEDYNKIPKTKIELFEVNASKTSSFKYTPNKTLQEQNVSNITKGIIITLFRDYWANEMQKNKIFIKQNNDRIKLEEKKRLKYNPNKVFTNYSNSIIENTEKSEQLSLIKTNDIKWYEKIWKFLINFFNK